MNLRLEIGEKNWKGLKMKSNKTTNQPEPVCPYCLTIKEDWAEYGEAAFDSVEYICGSCKKIFKVDAFITYSFNSYKKEEYEKRN